MPKYTKEQLINTIQQFYQENNRVPKVAELPYRLEVFRSYFGGYTQAILAAGLQPTRQSLQSSIYCKQCNTPFSPVTSKQLFCSKSCAATYNNLQRAPRTPCLHCGTLISQGNKNYCSAKCHKHHIWLTETLPLINEGLVRQRRTLRKYLLLINGPQCTCCNLTIWLSQPIPLEVDHIDGDASNNKPSNIRLICPNCHALTPTWKGRNRHNGRKSRGLL